MKKIPRQTKLLSSILCLIFGLFSFSASAQEHFPRSYHYSAGFFGMNIELILENETNFICAWSLNCEKKEMAMGTWKMKGDTLLLHPIAPEDFLLISEVHLKYAQSMNDSTRLRILDRDGIPVTQECSIGYSTLITNERGDIYSPEQAEIKLPPFLDVIELYQFDSFIPRDDTQTNLIFVFGPANQITITLSLPHKFIDSLGSLRYGKYPWHKAFIVKSDGLQAISEEKEVFKLSK